MQIKLYWTDIGEKPDIIVEVQSPEVKACMEILHGLYQLETFERWQNDPSFADMYEKMWFKCEAYIDRIKKLKRIHKDKWDWDWVK